jgi:hypothetical protein
LRPTSIQILRAVLANLDELILPQLAGAHAQSAGTNAKMLLEHVLVRLESEGLSLAADNHEKRALLHELSAIVSSVPTPRTAGEIDILDKRLDAIPEHGRYVTVESLTEESDLLRGLTNDWILTLHRHRDALAPETFDAARESLRKQLRAQLDRDAALVAPIAVERILENKDA